MNGSSSDRFSRAWLHRPQLVMVAAAVVVAGMVAAVVMIAISYRQPSRVSDDGPPPLASVPTANTPAQAEVQPIHDALHDIAARCRPGAVADDPARVTRDTDVIRSFARRHPDVAFPIDDERGTTLSLLLVTRQALADCSPALAAAVDEELPTEYRSGSR